MGRWWVGVEAYVHRLGPLATTDTGLAGHQTVHPHGRLCSEPSVCPRCATDDGRVESDGGRPIPRPSVSTQVDLRFNFNDLGSLDFTAMEFATALRDCVLGLELAFTGVNVRSR